MSFSGSRPVSPTPRDRPRPLIVTAVRAPNPGQHPTRRPGLPGSPRSRHGKGSLLHFYLSPLSQGDSSLPALERLFFKIKIDKNYDKHMGLDVMTCMCSTRKGVRSVIDAVSSMRNCVRSIIYGVSSIGNGVRSI